MLGGGGDQEDVGAGGASEIAGHGDARGQCDAWQFRVFTRACDVSGMRGIARVKRNLAPGPRGNAGECRTPGTGADDRD